jgi:hypothetical protein
VSCCGVTGGLAASSTSAGVDLKNDLSATTHNYVGKRQRQHMHGPARRLGWSSPVTGAACGVAGRSNQTGGAYLNGQVSNLRFYSKALSASEVAALALDTPVMSRSANPVQARRRPRHGPQHLPGISSSCQGEDAWCQTADSFRCLVAPFAPPLPQLSDGDADGSAHYAALAGALREAHPHAHRRPHHAAHAEPHRAAHT